MINLRFGALLFSIIMGVANTASMAANELTLESEPVSPAESLSRIHVRHGFQVELVAAEPLVRDPVAIAWGADGRLWVAEMADYPLGIDGQGTPGGRIRFLEDTDGDGRYDKSTLFLDTVSFPNGVMPWRGGVLVTAAPEIFYAEDTDGDGRADSRTVLLNGFQEGNQQLRVNGLRWGLDNWVYCASGAHRADYSAGSKIRSTRSGSVVALGSRDFRFRPDDGDLDPLSGPTQFGRNRDDWGHWFGCMNSYPLWHYVLRDAHLSRNPFVIPPDPRKQLVLPRNPRVFPAKTPQKRYHSFQQSGRFTSACSAMIYRDELLFPRDGTRHAFTCEPFHNLVQHNELTDDGVSFTARRAAEEAGVDFFASRDRWCRPVMVRTGPDGALWVVDMYRYMIEHPQFLTPAGREELKPFYRAGDDRGRIYRIYPSGKRLRRSPRLDTMTTMELVESLKSASGWQRDTAQQLLLWREDRSATPLLESLVTDGVQPLARLHALSTLSGMGTLAEEMLTAAFEDEHPGVRRHALRLAEARFATSKRLVEAARKRIHDPDAKVRLQLAVSLGASPDSKSGTALGQLAIRDAGDPYAEAAILSSVNRNTLSETVSTLLGNQRGRAPGRLLGELLALSVAFGDTGVTLTTLKAVLDPEKVRDFTWRCSTLSGLLDAVQKRGTSLAELAASGGALGEEILLASNSLTAQARSATLDERAADAERIAAVRLLGREAETRSRDLQALGRLLVPHTPPALQAAIVWHLGTLTDRQVAPLLLDRWGSHAPSLRAEILGVLLMRKEWTGVLLDRIQQKQLLSTEIDSGAQQRLMVYPDRAIRVRAARLFSDANVTDRQKVVHEYQRVLDLPGNRQRGAAVFKNKCSVCHQLGGVGHDVGPSLVSLSDRRPASLLASILDPSAAVDPRHVMYVAVTNDGLVINGMIVAETGSSLTFLGQENKRETVLRKDLEELQSSGKSLMPDGLEKDLSDQDVADLIAFLRQALSESSASAVFVRRFLR